MSSRASWLILGAVLALAVFLRLFDITGQSLWYDEGYSLTFSEGNSLGETLTTLTTITSSERYQPMYFVLLHGWRGVFGDSVLALRMLSAVCGLAAVVLLWMLARRIYGINHAFLSAVLLAMSGYAVCYSQEVRPYSLLVLLSAGQLWLFFKARDEAAAGRIWTWLFWASTGVGAFGSIFSGLFVGALCLAHLVASIDRRRQWFDLWLPAGLAMLPAVLYYADFESYAACARESPRTDLPLANAAFALYGLLVGTSFGPPLDELRGASKWRTIQDYAPHLAFLALAAGTMAVAWIVNFLKRSKDDPRRAPDILLLWLLVISFLFGVGFAAVTRMNWLPRHAFYLLPVLVLLVPGAARNEPRAALVRRIGLAGFVLLVAMNLFSVGKYYFDPRHARDDYRGAARYVCAHAGEQDKAVILWGAPELLAYYGAQVIDGRDVRVPHLAEGVNRISRGSSHVTLLVNRPFYWNSDPDAVEKHMASRYRLETKIVLQRFDIYQFVRTQPDKQH